MIENILFIPLEQNGPQDIIAFTRKMKSYTFIPRHTNNYSWRGEPVA
jgi:hypothetical protein